MCFKNLPIEFDESGKARLKEGAKDPYSLAAVPPVRRISGAQEPAVAEKPGVKELFIDPVTRIAGALAFHARVDLENRRVLEAHSSATLFRGYEVILSAGRDPRDGIDISSRACGVCGGVHSTCAALALEMAFPVAPPPMGILIRSLGSAGEMLYDHPLHLFLLAGPDYSEAIVSQTEPSMWEKAQKTDAEHAEVHGFRTIGDIMRGLNPLNGELYLEGLEMTRLAREACMLMYGKYPHPSTIVPGGMSTTISMTTFNIYHTRLFKLMDYAKKVAMIWEDLCNFLLDYDPKWKEVGRRPANIIDLGYWDAPEAYDGTYENADEWGERRWATPGVIIDGDLRTTKLNQINLGLEEFVPSSYYEDWAELDGNGQKRWETDPLGNPLSPFHPWNKVTKPRPTGRNFREKYSWATSPRWDRTVMETGGPLSRQWITALAQKLPKSDYLQATGKSIVMNVPRHRMPEMTLEWKVPEFPNAIERNRARAYHVAYVALVAYEQLLQALDYMKKGEERTWTPYQVPKRGRQRGVGYWGAGRGYLTHHIEIENGKLSNYQILTPSTWMASPRDPWGNPGAYEEAVQNTPILEEFKDRESFQGIDILRTIRSFDPCMPCTTHMVAGQRVITRDVTSCYCGLEDGAHTRHDG